MSSPPPLKKKKKKKRKGGEGVRVRVMGDRDKKKKGGEGGESMVRVSESVVGVRPGVRVRVRAW